MAGFQLSPAFRLIVLPPARISSKRTVTAAVKSLAAHRSNFEIPAIGYFASFAFYLSPVLSLFVGGTMQYEKDLRNVFRNAIDLPFVDRSEWIIGK